MGCHQRGYVGNNEEEAKSSRLIDCYQGSRRHRGWSTWSKARKLETEKGKMMMTLRLLVTECTVGLHVHFKFFSSKLQRPMKEQRRLTLI